MYSLGKSILLVCWSECKQSCISNRKDYALSINAEKLLILAQKEGYGIFVNKKFEGGGISLKRGRLGLERKKEFLLQV